jgi:hypothetical protein
MQSFTFFVNKDAEIDDRWSQSLTRNNIINRYFLKKIDRFSGAMVRSVLRSSVVVVSITGG